MKRINLFMLLLLALSFTFGVSSCKNDKATEDNDKTSEELLIGSWYQTNNDDSLKSDIYWHFNEDKTDQMVSVSSVNEDYAATNCGTWEIEGDIIKTVNLSSKEKVYNEWKILKLDKDSLVIEFYDKQPKRFETSFKRINK